MTNLKSRTGRTSINIFLIPVLLILCAYGYWYTRPQGYIDIRRPSEGEYAAADFLKKLHDLQYDQAWECTNTHFKSMHKLQDFQNQISKYPWSMHSFSLSSKNEHPANELFEYVFSSYKTNKVKHVKLYLKTEAGVWKVDNWKFN